MRLLGYADRLSARPGEVVRFMVSAAPRAYRAELVRLGGVDVEGDVAGDVRETPVASAIDGEHAGRVQPLATGSYAVADFAEPAPLRSFSLAAWVQPTLPAHGRQCVVEAGAAAPGAGGWRLELTAAGRLAFALTQAGQAVATVVSPSTVVSGAWLRVEASYDADAGRLALDVARLGRWEAERDASRAERPVPEPWRATIEQVAIGARLVGGVAQDCFDGRVEAPRIAAGEELVAAWDFSVGIDGDAIADVSGRERHGRLVNRPTRAVLGHAWAAGGPLRWMEDPSQWGAIHFHHDDLDDAGWEADFALTVPDDLPSGIYAARLTQGDEVEHVPFYVLPARDAPTADVLFLAPTNVYLAYGNERLAHGERGDALSLSMSEPIRLNATDLHLAAHPELGSSLYDEHADGSGVAFSSRLRPLVNMRPNYATWLNGGRRHFAADFFITGWLEARGIAFDVATEEDVDREGLELLRRYRVVVTGSHPEYPTAREYDALEAYLGVGGRLMYLGGNGFYWVTAFADERRHAIECRRGFAGFRNWTSHPAEAALAATGEPGGTWRHRGRAPQGLVGVGMCAAGFGPASPYVRTPESHDPEVAFVFEGVGDGPIGDFGLVLGGAAGDELDRTDPVLGTPPHATVLAYSQHGDHYWPAIETQMEITPGLSGSDNPEIRAELVLFDTDAGGRVFSTGSICWGASMAYDGYDNDVARLTENVLREFLR